MEEKERFHLVRAKVGGRKSHSDVSDVEKPFQSIILFVTGITSVNSVAGVTSVNGAQPG